MTQYEAHFEGQTNGVGITPTNSDDFGDNTLSTTILSTTMTFSNALSAHGTMSLKVDGGLTNPSNGYIGMSGLNATTNFTAQWYMYFTGLPTANTAIFATLDSASGALDSVYLRADGTVGVGPSSGSFFFSTAAISLNTWYRFDVSKIIATSGGKFTLTVNPLDGTSNPFGTQGPTSAATGSTAIGKVRLGKQTGSVPMDTFYIDDFRVNDATSTVLSPYSPPSNFPPTTTISPTTYTGTLGGALSITGTAADTDGTIASRTWTCTSYPGSAPTLTGASTNTVTFTPATAGVYKFQFSCTDNLGASPASPATATVFVPASNVTVNANPTNTGSWTGTYTDLAGRE
jgi:hypothetical protein